MKFVQSIFPNFWSYLSSWYTQVSLYDLSTIILIHSGVSNEKECSIQVKIAEEVKRQNIFDIFNGVVEVTF